MEGRAGDESGILRAVEPVSCQGMANGGQVQPQLMGAPGLRQETQEGPAVPLRQNLIAGAGGGPVGPDFSFDGGAFVPADWQVDKAAPGFRTAQAHAPVLPLEVLRMETPPQEVVDVAALGHRHEAGGALVQPVHHVEDAALPPLIGQGSGHGGGLGVEAGDHGHHPSGFVHHQEVCVLPDHRQRHIAGEGLLPGRPQVAAEHR